jgi:hypothetical protein
MYLCLWQQVNLAADGFVDLWCRGGSDRWPISVAVQIQTDGGFNWSNAKTAFHVCIEKQGFSQRR